ncbi:MAG: hypothetical protein MUC43_06865 [Pirellula sp.]|jgi:hypothetical protein|nr:hypothetical protein [Pirellula sp.]
MTEHNMLTTDRWSCYSKRTGATVLEVLFAVGIILVGLVGIAAMVPFAARQASQSYQITHGLATASNTLASFKGDLMIKPSIDRPWVLVDDFYAKTSPNLPHAGWVFSNAPSWVLAPPLGATNQSYFGSLERLYDGNAARGVSLYRYHMDAILSAGEFNGDPRSQIALAQNRALGQGFCIDPYFFAEQLKIPSLALNDQKVYRGAWGNFRRSRFPFYDELFPESMNPLEFPRAAEFRTPRLMRVSFRDNSLPIAPPADPLSRMVWLDKAWVRNDPAKLVASGDSRDINANKSEDRTSTHRQFQMPDDPNNIPLYTQIVKGTENPSFQSWIVTMTPAEETPIVNRLSIDAPTINFLPAMEFFPEDYDVNIIVFGRRNVRDLSAPELEQANYAAFAANGVVPQSERLARVTNISMESGLSGSFEVELGAYRDPAAEIDDLGNVSARINVGDWLMLSRYVYANPETPVQPVREKHRWYRVVGVTGGDIFPRRVRVAGSPWDWTIHELDHFKRVNIAPPAIVDPTLTPTVATLLRDVVTVYERRLNIKK